MGRDVDGVNGQKPEPDHRHYRDANPGSAMGSADRDHGGGDVHPEPQLITRSEVVVQCWVVVRAWDVDRRGFRDGRLVAIAYTVSGAGPAAICAGLIPLGATVRPQ